MQTVGYAALQIVPSMRGATKQIEGELNGLGKSGGRAGSVIGTGLRKGLKWGAAGIAGVAGTVAALAAKGGINRALAIEGAEKKLEGLGHSTKSISTIMGNALASVRGTAFGLGDAATVAASLSASGVKSGKELQGVLKTVADTAAISGRSLTDIGVIFGSVAARGKLQGDDMLQLMSSGVPVLQLVAKQLGITSAEASALVSKGKVDFKTFAAAMQAGMGGAALKSGETFKGALSNVYAALGRLGATVATPALGVLKGLFNDAIPLVDALTARVGPLAEALASRVEPAVKAVSAGISSFVTNVIDGKVDLSGFLAIVNPLGTVVKGMVPALAAAGGALAQIGGTVGTALAAVLPVVATALTQVGAAVGGALASALPALVPAFQAIGAALVTIAPTIGQFAATVAGVLATALPVVVPAVASLAATLGGALASALPAVVPLLNTVADLFVQFAPAIAAAVPPLASFAASAVRLVTPVLASSDALGLLVGGLVAWKAATVGIGAVRGVMAGVQATTRTAALATAAFKTAAAGGWVGGYSSQLANLASYLGRAAAVAKGAALAIGRGIAAAATSAASALASTAVAAGRSTAAWVVNTGTLLAQKAALLASAAASAVMRGATLAWTAVQWALNAALTANPIGLVVVAIGALVAAVVIAWKKSETFRNVVIGAWTAIKTAATAVWGAVKTVVTSVVGFLVAYVKAYFTVWRTIVTTAWNVIRTVAVAVWNGVKAIVTSVVSALVSFVRGYFTMWRTIVVTVWNAIRTATTTAWNAVRTAVLTALTAVGTVILSTLARARSIITSAWETVRSATVRAWSAVRSAVSTGVSNVIAFVRDLPGRAAAALAHVGTTLLSAGRELIAGLVQGIRNSASSVISTIKSMITDKLPAFVKKAFGIASPSKVFRAIGRWLPLGLAKGVADTRDEAVKAITKVTDQITSVAEAAIAKETTRLVAARKKQNDAIRKWNKAHKGTKNDRDLLPALTKADAEKQARKNLGAVTAAQKKANALVNAQGKTTAALWARGSSKGTDALLGSLTSFGNFRKGAQVQSATLADFAKAREVLAGRLAAARDKLSAAVQLRDDFKASVIESVKSFTSLMGAQAKELEDGTQAVLTASDITSHMQQRLSLVKTFASNMATLLANGLNKEAYEELIRQGPEAAGAYAQALVTGGKSAVSEVNSLTSQINAAASSFGGTASSTLYQAGVDSAQGLVDGIESQIAKVDKAATKVADSVVAAVKKALGIKSPSRVLALIGRFTTSGFGRGIANPSELRKATAAAKNVSNRVAGAFNTVVTPALASPTVATPYLASPKVAGPLVSGGAGGQRPIEFQVLEAETPIATAQEVARRLVRLGV